MRSHAKLKASSSPSTPIHKKQCRPRKNDPIPDMHSELEESVDEHPINPAKFDDNGTRRCCLHQTSLQFVAEAIEAAGLQLGATTVQSVAKAKRVRKKSTGEQRIDKPRDPARPSGRPLLKVIGDDEFATSPPCTKVKMTLRLLAVENMPGPYKSYKMFPIDSRLTILRKFLQRYTWAPDEDIKRCLSVYEEIAAGVYTNELIERRKECRDKYGEDEEEWKKHPPCWCRNVDNWKDLCDIWSKEKWEQQSSTNQENMAKVGPIIHYVGDALPPTMSTATTSASSKILYTRDEVDYIINEKLAAQEIQYKAQLELLQKNNDYNQICIQWLLEAAGINPPPFNKDPSKRDANQVQGDVSGK